MPRHGASVPVVDLEHVERMLRDIVANIPPDARKVLLEALTVDADLRAAKIGSLHAAGVSPATVELLIDAGADPELRAELAGMLREA